MGGLIGVVTAEKDGLMPSSLVYKSGIISSQQEYVRVARINNVGFSIAISILKNHELNGDVVIVDGYVNSSSAGLKAKSLVKGALLRDIYYTTSGASMDIYVGSGSNNSQAIASLIGVTATSTTSQVNLVAVVGSLPNGAKQVSIT